MHACKTKDSEISTGPTTSSRHSNNLKNARSEINPNILRNLVEGMPGRIEKCIRLKGGYIEK